MLAGVATLSSRDVGGWMLLVVGLWLVSLLSLEAYWLLVCLPFATERSTNLLLISDSLNAAGMDGPVTSRQINLCSPVSPTFSDGGDFRLPCCSDDPSPLRCLRSHTRPHLETTRLESGSDYTIRVADQSSGVDAQSEEFTVLGTPDTFVEVTSPDGCETRQY